MPFIGFYVLTLGVLKNGMATVSPIPNLRLRYKYPCYPATFSLIVLWSVGLPGPAKRFIAPPRCTHDPHRVNWFTIGFTAALAQGSFMLLLLVLVTCHDLFKGCDLLCVYKLNVRAAWHDIFVTSLIRFICSKLVQSSCNSWCSGGCTSLCRTGSTSYTGQECRNPTQKDLEATEHHIHIHHTPYPPRYFFHLQLTKTSPHFHWCAASSIK